MQLTHSRDRSVMLRAVATLSAALAISLATAAPSGAAVGGTITGTVAATPQKYLGETVVYVKSVPGTYAPKTVEMDQKGMRFVPHVLAITAGDTVRFLNHDNVPHNVFSPEGGYNLGVWGPNDTRTHEFSKTGAFSQLCSLHPEMLAYVFVGQNPYEAVVDSNGHFTINGVPPGNYELDIWNSHLKAASQSVSVTAGGTTQASFTLRR